MEAAAESLPDLECVAEEKRAEALLLPLRARILELAREPASATEIARKLRLPRQRVNYHVRRLADRGLLRRAGRLRKRNMVEQRYVAAARSFLLVPEVLGPVEADWRAIEDTGSAAYLLALTARVQSDVARAWKQAQAQGTRLSTLSLKSQFRFESPEQRAEFARALRQAVVDVIARHTSVDELSGGAPAPGRPHRLVLGCYPYAPEEPPKGKSDEGPPGATRSTR
ncbi:MAG: helix-turn-helix domain-containing protein [Thermoanaerobaculia bacterium]